MEQRDLEKRIAKVVADANTADSDLARGFTMAGDDATGPTEDRPDVRAALSNLIPQLQAAKHQLDGYKQVHHAVDVGGPALLWDLGLPKLDQFHRTGWTQRAGSGSACQRDER